jgi:hypothetical protein
MEGKRSSSERSEELHETRSAAMSLAPAKKKKKLDRSVSSDRDEKGTGNRASKSIQDLVQLAVAKEELRGKKKKRDKLKNKQKLRKVGPTDAAHNTNGDRATPQIASTTSKKLSTVIADNGPAGMSGDEKKKKLESKQQAKVKKFGSWFPSAFTVKGSTAVVADTISIVLFYQYVEPPWSEARKQQVINFTPAVHQSP